MKQIQPEEVNEKQVLIDVRTHAEYESIHIPGSFNVPQDRLDSFKDQLSQLKEDVVFICRTGNRAEKACELLTSHGLQSSFVLDGGVKAWEEQGKEVNKGTPTWDMGRQVRFGAGLLVLTGTAIGFFTTPAFYAIPAFVGAGLIYSGVTNSCGMAYVLSKMPWNQRKHNVKETINNITTSQ